MMANMAMRPLFSSLVRISEVNWFHLKGSPKFPGSFTGFHVTASWPAIKKKRSEKPSKPLGLLRAANPLGTSSKPGNLTKVANKDPVAAIMANRPCLISAARRCLKPVESPGKVMRPLLLKPSGSKKPKGATAPGCSWGSKGTSGASKRKRPWSSLVSTAARATFALEAPTAPSASRPVKEATELAEAPAAPAEAPRAWAWP
mmetsp:Transcript_143541/g.202971  ORF Transcript_143541/g.202971 Transcript_143541/m.202971 type:complete len:202 (+) Transcript_143541:319-924(+)